MSEKVHLPSEGQADIDSERQEEDIEVAEETDGDKSSLQSGVEEQQKDKTSEEERQELEEAEHSKSIQDIASEDIINNSQNKEIDDLRTESEGQLDIVSERQEEDIEVAEETDGDKSSLQSGVEEQQKDKTSEEERQELEEAEHSKSIQDIASENIINNSQNKEIVDLRTESEGQLDIVSERQEEDIEVTEEMDGDKSSLQSGIQEQQKDETSEGENQELEEAEHSKSIQDIASENIINNSQNKEIDDLQTESEASEKEAVPEYTDKDFLSDDDDDTGTEIASTEMGNLNCNKAQAAGVMEISDNGSDENTNAWKLVGNKKKLKKDKDQKKSKQTRITDDTSRNTRGQKKQTQTTDDTSPNTRGQKKQTQITDYTSPNTRGQKKDSVPKLRKRMSDRDTENYRLGYPGKKDNLKLTANKDFYMGEIQSTPDGDYIDVIHKKWKGDYRLLERHHGYIQWLFPIREDGMNWHAQALQLHEAEAIRADEKAKGRVLESYKLMLDFYGMKLVDAKTGKLKRTENWEGCFENLSWSSHNYLRITRILKSLGELGYEHLKKGFIEFILEEALVTRELERLLRSCQDYWIGTIKNDDDRESLYKDIEDKQFE